METKKPKGKDSLKIRSSAFSRSAIKGKIFVISGPSGSGKTTLLAKLLHDKKIGRILVKSCSVTTRPRRAGERQGRDYFFVGKNEFNRLLKAKKILEWTRYLGYYYGTPKDLVETRLKEGKHIGLCLDINGARILRKKYPRNAVTIFVLPPSLKTLKTRIESRRRETSKEEVRQRLFLAKQEILAASQFKYCVLNENLKSALEVLKKIFFKETVS
ncbi:MAG: guanylate kinase [Candidatus Omnitrophota bacterium]|nr:guanylate kinase [Candidatus Omnitrophota bacterium]